MASNIEYVFYMCRDCDIDFFLAKKGSGRKSKFCPLCGDNLYTEKVSQLWVQRPFQYKRKWTAHENEIIVSGRMGGYDYKTIRDSLPGRTADAVYQQWKVLRGRGADKEWLTKNKNLPSVK